MIDENISTLIQQVYRGAEDDLRWDAAMQAICAHFGAKWMLIGQFDERGGRPRDMEMYRVPDGRFLDGVREYAEFQWREDPTNRFTAAHPMGGIFDSRIISSAAAYLDHAYVRWNRDRLRSSFWQLHYKGKEQFRFGLSLHRDDDAGPLNEAESRLLACLVDHVAEAARLAARPPDLTGQEAVIILGRRGEVLACSANADAILCRGDALKVSGNYLKAANDASQARLTRAIAELTQDCTLRATASIPLTRAGGDLLAVLSRLPAGAHRGGVVRPAILLRLLDRDAPRSPPLADWEALFQFTPAERRLAAAMLDQPGNLRATAHRLGVSYATVRAQLAALFEKSDTSSQVELIALLTRLG